jgi:hypothetical protein
MQLFPFLASPNLDKVLLFRKKKSLRLLFSLLPLMREERFSVLSGAEQEKVFVCTERAGAVLEVNNFSSFHFSPVLLSPSRNNKNDMFPLIATKPETQAESIP